MKKMGLSPSTVRKKQGQNCRILFLCLLMGRFPYFSLLGNKKFQNVRGAIQKIANVNSFIEKLKTKVKTYRQKRYQEDYFPYEKEGIYKEDPTQFYPNHPINQYPKLYNVSGNND